MKKYATIDAYIAALPEAVRAVATELRAVVRTIAPDAVETVKYDMPSFQMDGVSFIYFAVWKKHVGLYPIYTGDDAFEDAVRPFRAKKDSVQFALGKPLPKELIVRIVRSQLSKLAARAAPT